MTAALIRPSLRPHPLRAALSAGFQVELPDAPSGSDLRLFLTAWLGGLVFFGTLFA
ncbi:MAG TPA: hypothetical protein VGC35_09025 [Allosphingosinicella sp.]|jgi:hypothetical protein